MSPDFEIIDPRFKRHLLGNCRVERLYTGTLWAEGPCYFADGNFLVWSDIPNDRMMRWVEGLGVNVFRLPANNTNGHTRTARGGSCPASMARAGSPGPSWMAGSRCSPTATRASSSTRPTTSW